MVASCPLNVHDSLKTAVQCLPNTGAVTHQTRINLLWSLWEMLACLFHCYRYWVCLWFHCCRVLCGKVQKDTSLSLVSHSCSCVFFFFLFFISSHFIFVSSTQKKAKSDQFSPILLFEPLVLLADQAAYLFRQVTLHSSASTKPGSLKNKHSSSWGQRGKGKKKIHVRIPYAINRHCFWIFILITKCSKESTRPH